MDAPSYPKHARSTLNRLRNRAAYDYQTIHSIVNKTSILHVSFLPSDPAEDPFPTILPMIGHMGLFENPSADPAAQPLDLYIHGHAASRLMKLPQDPHGLPVCVAATLLDGFVLALTPFNHSCNYRSAVLHGYAERVTDEAEIDFALRLITDGLISGRWDNSRVPPTKAELTSTSVLRVRVVSASAKVRTGPPGDDRKDLKDEGVTGKVWTGVIPVWEKLGDPAEGPKNLVKELPGYLDGWIKEKNVEGERYAVEVATVKK